ncbi:MAG: Lysine-tRNA ligase [Candidatus Peregrinibacteria bacterium GW2011_GWA2_54_9]|nr:MAG: Lysine-tRNA ligase [Candidatus Peregrinibacteria bacterium GW2011_GWA2_54_9]
MGILWVMDEFRLKKAETLRKKGPPPYAATFDRTHMLGEGRNLSDGTKIRAAGRVMLFREMGGMIFATLQDHTGRLQVAWKADEIPEEEFRNVLEFVDLGDIIGISGERFTTKKGEPTILVKEWTMLSKALRQPPEKWHGIADQETAWRQRYLDLMSNRETYDRFLFRSLFLRRLREFYWAHDFIEVETPVLTNAASGALATPFVTHHKGYDLDVFLRIAAGETFQKECLVGGVDRTFEVARCFRNEGLDPSHLQDFTMVEHYAAYWDYEQNMAFTEEMLSIILKDLMGTTKLQIPNREGKLLAVDFKPPWPRASIAELIQHDCGIDIRSTATADDLRKEITRKKIHLEVDIASLERGNLIDQLYKKVSRPKIVQPTFLTNHPTDLSPLARLNDDDPAITDRFQLVVGGWEIVNAYSELIDPVDQARRFEEQAKARAKGDTEAHRKDDEFVKALEYGCPPCSGLGMGIDRIVALLTFPCSSMPTMATCFLQRMASSKPTLCRPMPTSSRLVPQWKPSQRNLGGIPRHGKSQECCMTWTGTNSIKILSNTAENPLRKCSVPLKHRRSSSQISAHTTQRNTARNTLSTRCSGSASTASMNSRGSSLPLHSSVQVKNLQMWK